ncbi:hypothetical protein Ctob_016008, partial [Chrysochromulina tobinii]
MVPDCLPHHLRRLPAMTSDDLGWPLIACLLIPSPRTSSSSLVRSQRSGSLSPPHSPPPPSPPPPAPLPLLADFSLISVTTKVTTTAP